MEYRIQLVTPVTQITAVDTAIRELDPAAFIDQDPADGCLRVTAWLSAEDLSTTLAQAGFPARSVALQPSVCCGDCSG
ncbi:MAG TPA: hypothetical protein PL007_04680 [Thermomonas sp.]|jgi:hypothetical protein|nr:hypothetical protein [Thermomonas sp.]HRA55901.1 hypothetical protein [Thermomonas sp.]